MNEFSLVTPGRFGMVSVFGLESGSWNPLNCETISSQGVSISLSSPFNGDIGRLWRSCGLWPSVDSLHSDEPLLTHNRLDQPRKLRYSQHYDLSTYASALGLIGLAASLLDNRSTLKGQNRVYHLSGEGNFAYLPESTCSKDTMQVGDEIIDSLISSDVEQFNSDLTRGAQQPIYEFCEVQDMLDALEKLVDPDESGSPCVSNAWAGNTISGWLTSFQYELNQTSDSFYLKLTYTMVKRESPHSWHWRNNVEVTFWGEHHVDSLDWYDIQSHYRSDVAHIYPDHVPHPNDPNVGDHWEFTSRCYPLVTMVTPSNDNIQNYLDEVYGRLRHHGYTLHGNFKYLTGAAMASATDAIQSLNTIIESNFLENLTDLTALVDVSSAKGVPVEKILQAAHDLRGFSGLLKLADILSKGYLIKKFVVDTTISDIEEFVTKWDAIMKRSLAKNETLYGKATHSFTLCDIPVTMVTRTTARVYVPPDSVVNTMFSLRQLGLEPSLANLWDTVSLSFVVDWFASIGERLQYVDSHAYLIFVLARYYVHSYTLYIDINDIPGFSGIGQLVLYRREVSSVFPYANQTSANFHDWLGSVNVPPDVAGALLWTFARG